MVMLKRRRIFLPGASGSRSFWRPVAGLLSTDAEDVFIGYPGFDGLAHQPGVESMIDLVDLVAAQVDRPVDLLAQSAGGVLATQVALRMPHLVKHLVLVATSGGTDISRFRPDDWRTSYVEELPEHPRWFVDDRTDVSDLLGDLPIPTLLIYGDDDGICPPDVGKHLRELLPQSELVVIETNDHMFARGLADQVAPHIGRFLSE